MNQKGFTLIEILAVMVILSTLGSVAFHKFNIRSDSISIRTMELAIKELNVRESLTWTNIKLSLPGWTDDQTLFDAVDTNLGPRFYWDPPAKIGGGTLIFDNREIPLIREESTFTSAGFWHD